MVPSLLSTPERVWYGAPWGSCRVPVRAGETLLPCFRVGYER